MEKIKNQVEQLEKDNRELVDEKYALQTSLQVEVLRGNSLKGERDRSVNTQTVGSILTPSFFSRLTGLEAQFEKERRMLQSQVGKLEVEKLSLLQKHHALEVSCAKANILSDLLSVQLKEQKAHNLKYVSFSCLCRCEPSDKMFCIRLDTMYRAEQEKRERAKSELEEKNLRLLGEVETLGVGKEDALRHCQKLQEQLDRQEQAMATARAEYEAKIQHCTQTAQMAGLESTKGLHEAQEELAETLVRLPMRRLLSCHLPSLLFSDCWGRMR